MTTMAEPSLANILCLLERYVSHRDKGDESFKKALWNVTKARHGSGETVLASDVRIELSARAAVVDPEPSLVEDGDDIRDWKKANLPRWELIDPVTAKRSTVQSETIENLSQTAKAEGIRRRRGKEGEESKGTAWTVEEHEAEEDALKNTDPLYLFGVPTQPLRVAQRHAKETLECYIRAACLKHQIELELESYASKQLAKNSSTEE